MNKSILYISYDGMTDPLGQSQVIPYICGLSKLGYKITLLTCEKKERFRKFHQKIREQLENAGIDWHYYFFSTRPPLVSKFWDVYRLKKKAVALHKEKNFQIVHCRSYMASMAGMHLKKKYGVRFIFDMRGFWADERVDGGVWNLKNPVYKRLYNYFKKFERQSILKADAIVCLTRMGIKEMKSWDYVDPETAKNIWHITTCCDITAFRNVFLERKKRSFDEKNIRLVYIGSIGPWHSYDKLTAFIKTAYEKIPDSFFKLIISSGAEAMEEFIAANKFRRDRFEIKFVPHREIPEAIKDADIAFFFIPQQYSKIASSPTKMGEMLSAGLPVITGSRIGDVDELVKKNRIGTILEDFDEKAIVNSLSGVIQMCRNEQQALMDRCLETADDYFSLEKGIRKYEEIYATLIQKGA